MKADLLVVGAGASGMMAAITAAKKWKEQNKKYKIVLLERLNCVGKKISVTGNGRCNLTNHDQNIAHYHTNSKQGFEIVESILKNTNDTSVCQIFQKLGLMTMERNGYVYPASLQAASVVDVLRRSCEAYRIEIITDAEVKSIQKQNSESKECYTVKIQDGRNFHSEKIILACGSGASIKGDFSGYVFAKQLGHKIIKPLPSLCGLCVDKQAVAGLPMGKFFFKATNGVRTDVRATVCVDGEILREESGELQITEYGLSGIVMFNLSRYAARAIEQRKKCMVICDFLSDYTVKDVYTQFMNWSESAFNLEQCLGGYLNQKLALALIKLLSGKYYGIQPEAKITELKKEALVGFLEEIKNVEFGIEQVVGMERAQVCSGGVALSEVNENLESIQAKGLYFVGEVLDVDGDCGGYNLQWAWASGICAGYHATIEA